MHFLQCIQKKQIDNHIMWNTTLVFTASFQETWVSQYQNVKPS